MPIYTFRDRTTLVEETLNMSCAAREIYLVENPDKEHIIVSAPTLGYHYTRQKPSQNLREKLTKIKKDYKGSTVNDY